MSLLILNIRKLVTLPSVAGPGGPNGRSFGDMSDLCVFPHLSVRRRAGVYVLGNGIPCANDWGSQVVRHTWDHLHLLTKGGEGGSPGVLKVSKYEYIPGSNHRKTG